jgi:outer membrane protein
MNINLSIPARAKAICAWRIVLIAVLAVMPATPLRGQTLGQSSPSTPPAAQPRTEPQGSPLTLDEALRLAQATASAYEQAKFGERIAEEDVRQAQTAFLPRFVSQATLIYTSPSAAAVVPGTPRTFSFIGANAITEYQALAGVIGEVDLSGKLRAALRRNRALLAAAHAGTEIERRNLVVATVENYYGLGLAAARRHAAELNLNSAMEFERITGLLATGGEVAQVDLVRARLQTSARRDELEQARAGETAAAESLRVLIGYDLSTPLVVTDVSAALPDISEVGQFTAEMIARRPELRQVEAQREAIKEEAKQARSERRPQITYSVNGGFATDSLRPTPLRDHSGAQATVGVTIPLFDWGASKSRERQAQFRLQTLDSARSLALRNYNQQFATARAQALSAAERIRLTRVGVTDAERNLEISIARYRAGEAQIIEVSDAQNTLIAQRTALNQALFDYQVALARLRQSTGQ